MSSALASIKGTWERGKGNHTTATTMSRPQPLVRPAKKWFEPRHENETIDDIRPHLLYELDWIAYHTAALDAVYYSLCWALSACYLQWLCQERSFLFLISFSWTQYQMLNTIIHLVHCIDILLYIPHFISILNDLRRGGEAKPLSAWPNGR